MALNPDPPIHEHDSIHFAGAKQRLLNMKRKQGGAVFHGGAIHGPSYHKNTAVGAGAGAGAGAGSPKANRATGATITASTAKIVMPGDDSEMSIPLGDYRLMEGIGKGGFGTVFRGLNIITGRTVAIKRVSLLNIPEEELDGIEAEITLLKNLFHPNIVTYLDTIRTNEHLNIILEYAENGSLNHLLHKMGGRLPEQLVCHYVAQVLIGLQYLHLQGVVHRDIKGANILATKDGSIKLADFGVATKLMDGVKASSVVGTPYWMAPEVIEMTGQQSSSCDIWSVGCTVIELLTGKPPYFDLQQMPALFRIVQDDHPPLPESITPALEDFLLQCFQKDPNRRIDATGLLKHPWLKKAAEKNAQVAPAMKMPIMKASPTAPLKGNLEVDSDEDWDAEVEQDVKSTDSFNIPGKPQLITPDVIKMLQQNPKALPFVWNNPSLPQNLSASSPFPLKPTHQRFSTPLESSSKWAVSTLKPAPVSNVKLNDKDMMDIIDEDEPELTTKVNTGNDRSYRSAASTLNRSRRLDEYVENEEPVDDMLDTDADGAELELKIAVRTEKKTGSDSEEEDPFDNVDFEDERNGDENGQMMKQLGNFLSQLSLEKSEETLLDICTKLAELNVKLNEQARLELAHLVVIPLMEMLVTTNMTVLHSVLEVLNSMARDNQKLQQSLSLAGVIPAMIRFGGKRFPVNIRLQATEYIRQLCYTSDFSRKMFIACDGLPVLVGFLDENYEHNRRLIWNAIDCIRHVFDIASSSKNDLCRLFCKYQLLPPLSRLLLSICADGNKVDYLKKLVQIMLLFSEGDKIVKQHFAKQGIICNIVSFLRQPQLPSDIQSIVLKTIRNISMESMNLDILESCHAIPVLIPYLASSHQDQQHQALLALYYLCQIKPSRQEAAAIYGIVPHLQLFIQNNHPLKQFAYPIIFMLGRTSRAARLELRKYQGVQFYILCLKDMYWRTQALEVLAVWLSDDKDRDRVEFVINTPKNIIALVSAFESTVNGVQFEHVLASFRKIGAASVRVNEALGCNSLFIQQITARLKIAGQYKPNGNGIRVNLLKLLALLLASGCKDTRRVFEAHAEELLPLLQTLAADKENVIVEQLAAKLFDKLSSTAL